MKLYVPAKTTVASAAPQTSTAAITTKVERNDVSEMVDGSHKLNAITVWPRGAIKIKQIEEGDEEDSDQQMAVADDDNLRSL